MFTTFSHCPDHASRNFTANDTRRAAVLVVVYCGDFVLAAPYIVHACHSGKDPYLSSNNIVMPALVVSTRRCGGVRAVRTNAEQHPGTLRPVPQVCSGIHPPTCSC
jgi:hypothetical protein